MMSKKLVGGAAMAFLSILVVVLLGSCQNSVSQPTPPMVTSVGNGKDSLLWLPFPIIESDYIQVDKYSAILDSFPKAKDFFDTLKQCGFRPVRAEKINFFGSWLNGEGAIGAIRFDYYKPQKPGLWMVMGRGFSNKRFVTILIPTDEKESAYYVYTYNDSIGGDFHILPFLVRSSEYGSYREYANAPSGGGGWGSFAGFMGDLLGYIANFQYSECADCRDAAFDLLDVCNDFQEDLLHMQRNINRYTDCCTLATEPTLPSTSVNTWLSLYTTLTYLSPPASPPCGYSGPCITYFNDWGDYYDDAVADMLRMMTKYWRMESVCWPCLFKPGVYRWIHAWYPHW